MRANHTVSRIRSFPAPETVTARRASGEQVTTAAPMLPARFRPTAQLVLDDAPRIGAMIAGVSLDSDRRLTLPSAAVGVLGLTAGAQALPIAMPVPANSSRSARNQRWPC